MSGLYIETTPIFQQLKEMRAVVNGTHPLQGWQHKSAGATSVVRQGTTVVVLVPTVSDEILVTTYWDTDRESAEAILACVRGKHTWDEMWRAFDEKVRWSGGPVTMSQPAAFAHLATVNNM